MGYEECKEFLEKNLEAKVEKIEVIFDKIKQTTIRVQAGARKRAVEIFEKILSSPEHAVEAEEIEGEYSPVEIALVKDVVQYAGKWKVDGKWYYIPGSLAERDLKRGYCPGHAIVR